MELFESSGSNYLYLVLWILYVLWRLTQPTFVAICMTNTDKREKAYQILKSGYQLDIINEINEQHD
ncbi:MAG: hypothetical protein ACJAXY_001355 [Nonlabens sp.]|jgi:hypothetical protein